MSDDPQYNPAIRDDVMVLFAAAGFEVRDGAEGFAICGSIDSAAILVEMIVNGEMPGEREEDAN